MLLTPVDTTPLFSCIIDVNEELNGSSMASRFVACVIFGFGRSDQRKMLFEKTNKTSFIPMFGSLIVGESAIFSVNISRIVT